MLLKLQLQRPLAFNSIVAAGEAWPLSALIYLPCSFPGSSPTWWHIIHAQLELNHVDCSLTNMYYGVTSDKYPAKASQTSKPPRSCKPYDGRSENFRRRQRQSRVNSCPCKTWSPPRQTEDCTIAARGLSDQWLPSFSLAQEFNQQSSSP